MTGWELAVVCGVGVIAGAINAVVGSGSLITFPTLVALGVDPVVANVSNTVGLVPGSRGWPGYSVRERIAPRRGALRHTSRATAGECLRLGAGTDSHGHMDQPKETLTVSG